MAGRELKELFRSFKAGDELTFRRAAQAIIEEEEAKQHLALARDLRKLLVSGDSVGVEINVSLPAPPTDGDLPLAEVRHPSRYLADLVLAPNTERQLSELADEAQHREKLEKFGIPSRRRILFHGPPGCGKTTAAEALAAELGLPLVVVRLDSVVSSFLGQTAANLRQLIEYASNGSWVVLFDEFDALGRSRNDPTEHGEIKRVVNAFLQMLDGYTGQSLLIASTNYDQLLDAALWRRFDDVVEFPLPTVPQIRKVLRSRLRSVPTKSLLIDKAASSLRGLPHAAVEAAAWAASRGAVLEDRDVITQADLEAAIAKVRSRPW